MLGFVNQLLTRLGYNKYFGSFPEHTLNGVPYNEPALNLTNKFPQFLGTSLNRGFTEFEMITIAMIA